jgi:hypothetical protein
MSDFRVEVFGAKEVVRAFKALGFNIGPDLKKEFRVIAYLLARLIAARTPKRKGNLAGSVQPTSTQKGFGVKVGGGRAPFYVFPQEFGGTVPLYGGPKRVLVKPYNRSGYFIFPTIRSARPDIQRAADQAIGRAIERHFR